MPKTDKSAQEECRRGHGRGASKTSRTAMETPRKQQTSNPSDTSAGQIASNELIKLIRKLRWLGMEEEAQGLQKELERRRATAADSVLAKAAETD